MTYWFALVALAYPPDPYELLGVPRSPTYQQVDEAYSRLSKECDPKTHPSDPSAERRFVELGRARDLLKDSVGKYIYLRGAGVLETSRDPEMLVKRMQELYSLKLSAPQTPSHEAIMAGLASEIAKLPAGAAREFEAWATLVSHFERTRAEKRKAMLETYRRRFRRGINFDTLATPIAEEGVVGVSSETVAGALEMDAYSLQAQLAKEGERWLGEATARVVTRPSQPGQHWADRYLDEAEVILKSLEGEKVTPFEEVGKRYAAKALIDDWLRSKSMFSTEDLVRATRSSVSLEQDQAIRHFFPKRAAEGAQVTKAWLEKLESRPRAVGQDDPAMRAVNVSGQLQLFANSSDSRTDYYDRLGQVVETDFEVMTVVDAVVDDPGLSHNVRVRLTEQLEGRLASNSAWRGWVRAKREKGRSVSLREKLRDAFDRACFWRRGRPKP